MTKYTVKSKLFSALGACLLFLLFIVSIKVYGANLSASKPLNCEIHQLGDKIYCTVFAGATRDINYLTCVKVFDTRATTHCCVSDTPKDYRYAWSESGPIFAIWASYYLETCVQ